MAKRTSSAPALPRSFDSSFMAQEPKFLDGMPENDRRLVVMKSFNWYNYFLNKKEFKEAIIEYAKDVLLLDSKDIRMIKKAEDFMALNSAGSYARMMKNGWILSDPEKDVIKNNIDKMISYGKIKTERAKIKLDDPQAVKPNPQQFMLDKFNNTIAQDLFDLESEWAENNYSKKFDAYNLIKTYELKGATLNHIIEWINPRIENYEKILKNEDADLKEAYSHMSKADLKNVIKTLKNILEDIEKSKQVQKVTRTTTVKKEPKKPSVDKLIEYLQFQKEDNELKIASINPSKIIGAKRMVVLNTKYYYVTEFITDNREGLSVKRYSSYIENYSVDKSRTFTVPKKLINESIDAILNKTEKQFNNFLKNVIKKDNHPDIARRINKNTIILKVE